MQAITGEWPNLIREIQNQVLGEGGFEGYLEWGHARGRDFQCLTSIAYLIDKYPKQTTPGVAQLEKWLQDAKPVPSKFRDGLFNTFRIFVSLARDKKLNTPFRKPTRVSPIEFVMIGLLIHLHSTVMSPTQLSSAIEKLRADVRDNFIDIRLNTKTMKHMYNFIIKVKNMPVKSDGKGDLPATPKASAIPRAPPKGPVTKRKRVVDSDDDDAEPSKPRPVKDRPTASSKTAKIPATSMPNKTAIPNKTTIPNKTVSPPIRQPFTRARAAPENKSIPNSVTSKVSITQPPITQVGKVPTKPSRPTSNASGQKVTPPQGPSQPVSTPRVSMTSTAVAASIKDVTGAEPTPVQPPPRRASQLLNKSSDSPSAASPAISAPPTPAIPAHTPIAPTVSAPPAFAPARSPASVHPSAPSPSFNPVAPAAATHPSPPSPSDPPPQLSANANVEPLVRVKAEPQDASLISTHGQRTQTFRDRLAPLRAAKAAVHVSKTEARVPFLRFGSPTVVNVDEVTHTSIQQGDTPGPSTGTGTFRPGTEITQESIEALLVRTGLQKSLPNVATSSQTQMQAQSLQMQPNGNNTEGVSGNLGAELRSEVRHKRPSWPGPSGASTAAFGSNRQILSGIQGSSHTQDVSMDQTDTPPGGSKPSGQSPRGSFQAMSQAQNSPALGRLPVTSSTSALPQPQTPSRPGGWNIRSRSRLQLTPSGNTFSGMPPPPSSAPTLPRPPHDSPYAPRSDRMRRSSVGSYDQDHDRDHRGGGPRYDRGLGGSGIGSMNANSSRDDRWRDNRDWDRPVKHWDGDRDWGDRARGRGRGRGRGGGGGFGGGVGGGGAGRGGGKQEYAWSPPDHRYGKSLER